MTQNPAATCEGCQKPFVRRSTLQKVCGPICAVRYVRAAKKTARQATKAARERLKPRSQWLREAQTAFNAWVRMRDVHKPCVSCLRMHDGQWHAGHYLSTGARPELRFDPANCHKQCQPCNTHLHGNLVLYRAELIRRIGLANVEWLEGPHKQTKHSVDDLRAIRDDYRAKLKAMQSCE